MVQNKKRKSKSREERIYNTLSKPTKLSDYTLIEGRSSNRKKPTQRGHKYRLLIPILLLIAIIFASTMSILFL